MYFTCPDHGYTEQVKPCCPKATEDELNDDRYPDPLHLANLRAARAAELHHPQAQPNPMADLNDLAQWVMANTSNTTFRDAATALIWFYACEKAEQLREVNTIKDWAHMLCDGPQPASLIDVEEWIKAIYEEYTPEAGAQAIIERLQAHFGATTDEED